MPVWLSLIIMVVGTFVLGMGLGSHIQREKLMDSWKEIEAEWADLAREKERWADTVSRRLSSLNEQRNNAKKS
jgi:hypothetical protein